LPAPVQAAGRPALAGHGTLAPRAQRVRRRARRRGHPARGGARTALARRRVNRVVLTALWTAAAPARESERGDRLFDDPLAARRGPGLSAPEEAGHLGAGRLLRIGRGVDVVR